MSFKASLFYRISFRKVTMLEKKGKTIRPTDRKRKKCNKTIHESRRGFGGEERRREVRAEYVIMGMKMTKVYYIHSWSVITKHIIL